MPLIRIVLLYDIYCNPKAIIKNTTLKHNKDMNQKSKLKNMLTQNKMAVNEDQRPKQKEQIQKTNSQWQL